MQSPYPLISAGITCFNARDTITRALRSAQNQDWPNLEIVIVDDCSTDGSLEVLEVLALEDERVRVVRHIHNLGVGAARNTLVREAKGEFLAFFDDDDESLPSRLTQQYQRLVTYEQNTGAGKVLCYAARRQVFRDGATRYQATIGMDKTPAPSGQAVADLILLGRPLHEPGGTCATCSLMARRNVFAELIGFNGNLRRGEDTDFNLRLALQGGHFAGLSAPLVTQNVTATADKGFEEERRNNLARIEVHRAYLEGICWSGFTIRWINIKFDLLQNKWASFLGGMLTLALLHPGKLIIRLWWLFLLAWRNRTVASPALTNLR